MYKNLNTTEELQAFCEAQQKTIIELSKKINKLDEEKKHLEILLLEATPITYDLTKDSSDEELICRTQLKTLADKCLNGVELNLEETKRVDTYTKLLLTINQSKKKTPASIKLDEKDLLSVLDNTYGTSNPNK